MIEQKLQALVLSIRRTPTPIADIIPLLNEAATEVERLRAEVEAHKRSRQIDANEARSLEMELRAEVEKAHQSLTWTVKKVERLKAAAHGALAAWHAGLCGEVGLADALRRIYEGEVRDADPTDAARYEAHVEMERQSRNEAD